MTTTPTPSAKPESAPYEDLCKTVAMFSAAKGLDEKSRDQLATIIALAMRIGQSLPPNP